MNQTAFSGSILIVEDDKKTASLVALYLEREGFNTLVASDGREALEAVRQERPALVILDVMMPGLTGFEVLEAIKAEDNLKDTPVVMLTARGQEADTLKGISLGAADYIVKPFRPAELLARVQRLLPSE